MIYVITHKKFTPYFEDKLHYKILHVGLNSNTDESYFNDNNGDNISEKNPFFCELTGLYWIWKDSMEDEMAITGVVHYRRYFTTKTDDLRYTYFNIMPHVLPYEKIEKGLKCADIILPSPEKIFRTVWRSYSDVHSEEDLILLRKSIEEICPDYLKAYDIVMKSHHYYYANMMICRKKTLDAYSSWLFPVLFNLENKIDIDKYRDAYQKRVFGFLSERLLQVWVYHNGLKVKEYPVFNTETKRITIFEKNKCRLQKIASKVKNIIKIS